jgi:hypothetical protein
MKEVIAVTISPTGEVRADVTTGPGGAGCVKALLALLESLSRSKGSFVTKRDFHATTTNAQKVRVGQ